MNVLSQEEIETICQTHRMYPVLDKGFVAMVSSMGTEESIANIARISYNKHNEEMKDHTKLIEHMYNNGHLSPFEQAVFTFHIKLPIFVARQLVRHRTARINEMSGRYVIVPDFYVPSYLSDEARKRFIEVQEKIFAEYLELMSMGVKRETARLVLPLSLYTELYWQIDLRNLLNFLRLRLDNHAQTEIRIYAKVIFDIISPILPTVTKLLSKEVDTTFDTSPLLLSILSKMDERMKKENISHEMIPEHNQ